MSDRTLFLLLFAAMLFLILVVGSLHWREPRAFLVGSDPAKDAFCKSVCDPVYVQCEEP